MIPSKNNNNNNIYNHYNYNHNNRSTLNNVPIVQAELIHDSDRPIHSNLNSNSSSSSHAIPIATATAATAIAYSPSMSSTNSNSYDITNGQFAMANSNGHSVSNGNIYGPSPTAHPIDVNAIDVSQFPGVISDRTQTYYQIIEPINEIIDENTPNVIAILNDGKPVANENDKANNKSPKTPITLPTPLEVRNRLEQLDPNFDTHYGFTDNLFDTLRVGEKFNVISTSYVRTLLNYIKSGTNGQNGQNGTNGLNGSNGQNGYGESNGYSGLSDRGKDAGSAFDAATLVVDNTSLFEVKSPSKMKKNARIRSDFYCVSVEVWDQLVAWFGGGPCIKYTFTDRARRAKRHIKDYEWKDVRAMVSTDLKNFRRVNFSITTTVGEMKKKLFDLFHLGEETPEHRAYKLEEIKLFDYFQKKPHCQLDGDQNIDLNEPISEKNLIEDNLLLLEVPLEDGSYVISKKLTAGQMRGTLAQERSDIIDGSRPEVIGAVGLRNIGNTCYMNSTLQCLSNLPVLKRYFVSDEYATDINRDNPLGYTGRLGNAFSGVMKKLWQDQGSIVAPFGFKLLISEIKPEFQGFEQHDSQELLSQVLDGLHEDLNRVKNKPYTEQIVANGRPDAEVAAEALDNYKKRNDSKINDLFTGLFKSTVTCPDTTCNNVSVTFDPYMILPLPLQVTEKHYQLVHVIYVPMDENQDIVKIDLITPKHGPVFILKRLIAKKVGLEVQNELELSKFKANAKKTVDGENKQKVFKANELFDPEDGDNVGKRGVLLTKIKHSRILKVFADRDDLSSISLSHCLVAYEVYNEERFMDFCFSWDEDFQRPFQMKRHVKARNGYLSDSDREIEIDPEDSENDNHGHGRRNVRKAQEEVEVMAEVAHDSDDEYGSPEKLTNLGKQESKTNKRGQGPSARNQLSNKMTEKVFVGRKNCPLVAGDVWYGSYMFDDVEQCMRIEILFADRINDALYAKYRRMLFDQNISDEETALTEQELMTYDKYLIKGIMDTKERLPQYMLYRVRYITNTVFQFQGVYLTKKPEFLKSKNIDDSASVANGKVSPASSVIESVAESMEDNENSVEGNGTGPKDVSKSKRTAMSFWKSRAKSAAVPGSPKNTKRMTKAGSKRKTKDKINEAKSVPATSTTVVDAEKTSKATAAAAAETKSKVTVPDIKVKQLSPENAKLNLLEVMDTLKATDVEEQFVSGKMVLRNAAESKIIRKRNELRQQRQNFMGRGHDFQPDFSMHGGDGDEPDPARDSIITLGYIDSKHKYYWGKVNNPYGHRKGEFFAQKWESKNWDTTVENLSPVVNPNAMKAFGDMVLSPEAEKYLADKEREEAASVKSKSRVARIGNGKKSKNALKKTATQTDNKSIAGSSTVSTPNGNGVDGESGAAVNDEMFAKYLDPVPRNRDNRLLVLLAHRVTREVSGIHGGRYSYITSIPHLMLAPSEITEGEMYECLKAKFTILLKRNNEKLKRDKRVESDDDLWTPEEMMNNLRFVRANSKFETKPSNDPLNVGQLIEQHCDSPLLVDNENFYVWIVADWRTDTVLFEQVRENRLLDIPSNNEKAMNLKTALELFSRTERLNAMNSWYCSKCKTHQEAYKQLQIWSLPPILVIQFKRFSQDEGRNLADKLEIPVDFPLEIDMRDYALNSSTFQDGEFRYDLACVSSHVGGGLGEGHYVATCRNEVNGMWYHFDDSFVREVRNINKEDRESVRKVADPMAYVIFYLRRDLKPSTWN